MPATFGLFGDLLIISKNTKITAFTPGQFLIKKNSIYFLFLQLNYMDLSYSLKKIWKNMKKKIWKNMKKIRKI